MADELIIAHDFSRGFCVKLALSPGTGRKKTSHFCRPLRGWDDLGAKIPRLKSWAIFMDAEWVSPAPDRVKSGLGGQPLINGSSVTLAAVVASLNTLAK